MSILDAPVLERRPSRFEHPSRNSPTPQTTQTQSRISVRREMRASVTDGAAHSVMVGMGETYLPAFVIALGMGDIAAGMIATVPMMLGAFLQLISPWAIQQLGSHQKWVVVCARVQAMSWLVLLLATCLGYTPGWLVFAAATLHWGSGLAGGPAWNTLIEELIPRRIRARFFACRVRTCQACLMTAFLVGGMTLHLSGGQVTPLAAFGFLFGAAAAARFISARCLAAHTLPRRSAPQRQIGLRELLRRRSIGPGGRLVAYLAAAKSAVYMAGPFFAPFMLSHLHLTYLQYTLLAAVGYLGKVMALTLWGRFAHRFGARRLLWVGGVGIVPLSAAWLVSHSMGYLVLIQALGGVAWAAYELAMFLLFIEAIPKAERTSMLTLYNLGDATAIVSGGLLGATVLKLLGQSASSYLVLFAVSTIARAAALLLLARVPRSLQR